MRLPWHEGMRVSDLIPEKQALLTRNYWTEHNQLTAGSADFTQGVHNISTDMSLAAAISGDQGATKQRTFNRKNDLQPAAPDINWSYAAIERLDPQTLRTHLIPFDLVRAVLEHDEVADLTLQPGDIVNVFSMADFTAPVAEQTRIVRLEGEVTVAGIYAVRPGETLRELVARAGGLTDKAYLYAAEFTRESTRREQEKRMNDYLDKTEKELEQSSVSLSTGAIWRATRTGTNGPGGATRRPGASAKYASNRAHCIRSEARQPRRGRTAGDAIGKRRPVGGARDAGDGECHGSCLQ